jgi:hypothetical protein
MSGIDRNVLLGHIAFWDTISSMNKQAGNKQAASDYEYCYLQALELLRNFDARNAEMKRLWDELPPNPKK